MKKTVLTLVSLLLVFTGQSLAAQSGGYDDLMDALNKVHIESMDSLQFSENAFYILVTMVNKSDKKFKFENGNFDLVINPDETRFDNRQYNVMDKETVMADGMLQTIDYDYKVMSKIQTNVEKMKKLSMTNLTREKKLGNTQLAVGSPMESHGIELAANMDKLILHPGEIRKIIFKIQFPEDKLEAIDRFQVYNYLCFPPAVKKIAMVGSATVGLQIDRGWVKQKLEMELHSSAEESSIGPIDVEP